MAQKKEVVQMHALDRIWVQRHVVALVTMPVLCCMAIIAWGAITISDMEFTRAVGVSDNLYPTSNHGVVSLGIQLLVAWPNHRHLWAFLLVCRKGCSLTTLVCYIQFAIVFVTVWLVFSVCAFYLANQSFWGWRRIIVDHEVFVDKGLRPGQEPLLPGGNNLLPGELYDEGKWGTPGAINVLRTWREPARRRKGMDKRPFPKQ